MQPAPSKPRVYEETTRTDILAPLRFFYGLGSESPAITFVEPDELPATERKLLVHERDMTGRLGAHHADTITLAVHAKSRIGDYLVRASVLKKQSDGTPVEFGAIGIHLDGFDEASRKIILDGHVPLGNILHQCHVEYTSHPRGFFRIVIDHRLANLLGGWEGQTLHGRCNELRHADGTALAEVVEVLPSEASRA